MSKSVIYLFITLLSIISINTPVKAYRSHYTTPYIQNIARDGTQTIIYAGNKFYFTRDGYVFTHDYNRQTIRDLAKLLNLKGISDFKFIPSNQYGSIPPKLQSYAKYILNKHDINIIKSDYFVLPKSVDYHYHQAQQQLQSEPITKTEHKRTFFKYPYEKIISSKKTDDIQRKTT